MVYTIDELRKRILPITQKYRIPAVYLFGSYARNEATDSSDVDILIDREGSAIHGMFEMGSLYADLRESVGKEIDLVTLQTLRQESARMTFLLRIPALHQKPMLSPLPSSSIRLWYILPPPKSQVVFLNSLAA